MKKLSIMKIVLIGAGSFVFGKTVIKDIEFPENLAALFNTISDVHELIAEGAVNGDVNKLRQAIEMDPAIIEKKISSQVLDQMLDAHKDMLKMF